MKTRTHTNMSRIVVLLCMAALTVLTGVAQANDGGWGGEHCGTHLRHSFKKIEKKLGMTDAQKTQAKAIFQANRDGVKPIFTSLRAERQNLRALLHADAIDEAAIRAETARMAGIQADLNVARAKVGAQFRAILTPSQLSILKTMHQGEHKKNTVTTVPAG